MADTKKVDYPVTEDTLHKYAADIFTPIRRGESVTTVWVPMAGRRMWNKFLIENIQLFKNELPEYEKYVLVYIEPLDLTELSLSGYLRLIIKSFVEACERNKNCRDLVSKEDVAILDNESTSYTKLLEHFRAMLFRASKIGIVTVLFLGEFDELNFANTAFYNNLKSMWSNLYPYLFYVFLMRERITRRENISQWGELNEVILQNIVHVPLRNEVDANYLLDYYSKEYGTDLSEGERSLLRKLCDGHPYLLKVCVRVLSRREGELSLEETEKLLLSYYEARSVSLGILNVRSDRERAVLKTIALGKPVLEPESLELVSFFEDIGLVKKVKEDEYAINGEFLKDAILGQQATSSLAETKNGEIHFDEENGAIIHNGKTIEEKFTHQEYNILKMFLQNAGKLYSRDDIGEILWGKESYEKYSDWAIDQLMSKMRRKLKELGIKESITTVRGRGYKLASH